MKALVILVALASGCIEGDSEGHCEYSGTCSGGLVCAGDATCWPAEKLVELRVHWTLNGVAPSLAQPGKCDGLENFGIGVGDEEKNGFGTLLPCTDGVGVIERVPPQYRVVGATAYTHAAIAGQTKLELPADPPVDVTLDVVVP